MPTKSKELHALDSTENDVPRFNSEALRSLTWKIESNRKNQAKGAISEDTSARLKTKAPKVGKAIREQLSRLPALVSAGKAVGNGSPAIEKPKFPAALKTSQGKKRLRDGRVKEESWGTKRNNVNSIKLGTRTRSTASGYNANVEEEIRLLGGTKEDVDFIADVVSESEMEGDEAGPSKVLGNSLEKEILQVVRQLGVDRVSKKASMADSEADMADEAEEIVENRDSDMESLNKVTLNVKPGSQNAASVGKAQRSLVS